MLTAVAAGAAEAEVAEAEEEVVVEVAEALVVGVARAPRCSQYRWDQRRSNHLGHQRLYLPSL
jgi:hypothetical protein